MIVYIQKYYSEGEYGPFPHYSISKQSSPIKNAAVLETIEEILPCIEDAGERVIDIEDSELESLIKVTSKECQQQCLLDINSNYIKHHIGEKLWSRSNLTAVIEEVSKELGA